MTPPVKNDALTRPEDKPGERHRNNADKNDGDNANDAKNDADNIQVLPRTTLTRMVLPRVSLTRIFVSIMTL